MSSLSRASLKWSLLVPASFLLQVVPAHGQQNFVWARSMGGTASDFVLDVALDGSDNVYTVGCFFGTADFDPGAGTANLTSAGDSDIFVSKLDSNGNFVWARRMGGMSSDRALSVALDGSGNVYTVGQFLDPPTSTPEPAPPTSPPREAATSSSPSSTATATSSGPVAWAE